MKSSESSNRHRIDQSLVSRWGMNRCFYTLLFFAWAITATAGDMAQNVFFKALVGSWKAEGKLVNKEGKDVLITEEWTGRMVSADAFAVEGTRVLNGEKSAFKWSYIHNAATDIYEANLTGEDGNVIRFEGSFSDVNLTLELKSITGAGMSSITLLDSFKNEAHSVLETKVNFTGEQGENNLSGTVTHTKVEVK